MLQDFFDQQYPPQISPNLGFDGGWDQLHFATSWCFWKCRSTYRWHWGHGGRVVRLPLGEKCTINMGGFFSRHLNESVVSEQLGRRSGGDFWCDEFSLWMSYCYMFPLVIQRLCRDPEIPMQIRFDRILVLGWDPQAILEEVEMTNMERWMTRTSWWFQFVFSFSTLLVFGEMIQFD